MTHEMFPIYEVPKMRWYSDKELSLCHSLGDAYEMTMRLSKLNRKQIALQSGIATETLSMMCGGTRNPPADKMMRFFEVCQNAFALQWQMYQFGKVVKDKELTVEEKAELFDRMQRAAG